MYVTEINNYKQQIARLESQLNDARRESGELSSLRQQINVYVMEINNYKQQIARYESQFADSKK